MKNYFVVTGMAKIAKMLADKYHLTVKYQGSVPKTDGKTIVLPALSDELGEDEQQDLLAFVVHEVAHILFTDFSFAKKFTSQHGDMAFNLLNALEDVRIEFLIEKEYIGATQLLNMSTQRLTVELEKNSQPDNFRQFASMMYLFGRGYQIPSNWDDVIKAKVYQFKLELQEIINAKTTTEVAKVVLRILGVLEKEQSEDIQTIADDSCSRSEGDNDEPRSMSGSVSNNEEESDSESGSSYANSNDKGDNNARSDVGSDTRTSTSAKSINILQAEDSENPVNPHEIMVEILSHKCDKITSINQGVIYRRYDLINDIYETLPLASSLQIRKQERLVKPYVNGVRAKLLSALMSQGNTRWLSNQEEGVIDSVRLSQLISESSDKVFKRKVAGRSKSTAVTLLIDTSGSMSGEQIKVARSVAMVFADTLSRANIKTRVIGFDGSGEVPPELSNDEYRDALQRFTQIAGVHYSLLKDFNEPYQKVKGRFCNLGTGGITPLASSLLQEIRVLLHRPEDREILMVLTDGEPNSDGQISENDNRQICKDMITQAERVGIEVLGIGIGLDVSGIFDKNVMVTELKELPKTVVNQLYKILV